MLILYRDKLGEIVRFGLAGGLSFILDFGILFILTDFCHINYLLSAFISFISSILLNYIICLIWVFKPQIPQTKKATFTFFITSIIGLILNQMILMLLVDVLGIYYLLSKLVSTSVVMMWNYVTKRRAIAG